MDERGSSLHCARAAAWKPGEELPLGSERGSRPGRGTWAHGVRAPARVVSVFVAEKSAPPYQGRRRPVSGQGWESFAFFSRWEISILLRAARILVAFSDHSRQFLAAQWSIRRAWFQR